MSDKVLGQVVYLDGTTYKRQPDGSLIPVQAETQWNRINQFSEQMLL